MVFGNFCTVLLYHAELKLFRVNLLPGYIGIDVFVISGYLIGKIVLRELRTRHPSHFWVSISESSTHTTNSCCCYDDDDTLCLDLSNSTRFAGIL